jgi:rhamnosyl/mannosyltransferase
MKILEINKLYYPWRGGLETVTKDIAESLQATGRHQVEVLTCQARGQRTVEQVQGVTVYRAASLGRFLSMPLSLDFFRLFKELRKNKYDLIIFHHPFPLAFLVVPFLPKSQVISVWYHCDIVRQKILAIIFNPFLRAGLARAKTIFVSGQNLPRYSAFLKPWTAKCHVVPLAVADKILSPSPVAYEQAAKIKQQYGAPLLLSVGRLVYYKGFEYLIAALANSPYNLLIIGEGPKQPELLELITENNLQKQITIISPVSELAPYYLASDIFVFPSVATSEAYGIVQAEALASGRPVINTDLPTPVKEVSENNLTGLTVAPKNPAALRQAIDLLINDKTRRQEYGQNAKAKAQEHFSLAHFTAEIEKQL